VWTEPCSKTSFHDVSLRQHGPEDC
jgi:hypothetical protein